MSARNDILARIRSSLGVSTEKSGKDETAGATGRTARQKAVANRLKNHPRGVVPEPIGKKPKAVRQFIEKAQASGASVERVQADKVAQAVSTFLRNHNLAQQLRMGNDRRLGRIEWQKRGAPEILTGPSDGKDETGLSHAFAGAAETGTLVLLSGSDNPTTINFLPENHIVLVDEKDIAFDYETIWTKLRRKAGAGNMPRTVNLITGPSRSADIEQTLIMGAHGPVRLHIIVVKD